VINSVKRGEVDCGQLEYNSIGSPRYKNPKLRREEDEDQDCAAIYTSSHHVLS
jgi:hypothetical protein